MKQRSIDLVQKEVASEPGLDENFVANKHTGITNTRGPYKVGIELLTSPMRLTQNCDTDFDLRKTYIRIYKNEPEDCTLVEIYFDNYDKDLAVANTLLYVNNVNIIPQPLTVRLLIY